MLFLISCKILLEIFVELNKYFFLNFLNMQSNFFHNFLQLSQYFFEITQTL